MEGKLGYCKVSISPVRAENRDASEMVTQLLFGELVHVHEISGPWCRITVYNDNYPGWVDAKQIGLLTSKESVRWQDAMSPETALARQIETPWGRQWITRGAFVAHDASNTFSIGGDRFSFPDDAPVKRYASPQELALEYLNAPYLWGGRNPFGIDCSGFMQVVFRCFGINLPRDASQQAEHGADIPFGEAEPGDLAFFSNDAGKVIHVGLLLEDQQIIHASGQVRIDTLAASGIVHHEKKEITHTLCGIRRL